MKRVIFLVAILIGLGVVLSLIGMGRDGQRSKLSEKAPDYPSSVPAPTANAHVSEDEFEILWKTSEAIFNPHGMQKYNDVLVVRDSDAESPFLKFNRDGSLLEEIGEWGEGPGEFGDMPRLLGQLDSSHIALDDNKRRRFMRFDLDTGSYEGEMNRPSSGGVPAADDSLLIVRPSHSEHLLEGHQIDSSQPAIVDSKPPIAFGSYDKIPEIATAADNYLLKQGPMQIGASGTVYVALRFAGLIMGFERDGTLRFKTTEPVDIPLPDFTAEDLPVSDVTAASPPSNIYPRVFVGMSVGEQNIFAIYSGKKNTEEVSVTELGVGSRVYAYDKKTGDLAFSVDLPFPARELVVASNAVYVIVLEEEGPVLAKLSRPF